MKTADLLKTLTEPVAVSGAEDNIVHLLSDILKDYGTVTVDSFNNIFCTFGTGIHILIDAHIDEIGLVVKNISDDGFIKFDRCGGVNRRMLLGSEVTVFGDAEYRGVISTFPPHLQKSGDDKIAPEFEDISIDVGMCKSDAEKHIHPGDRITFKRNFAELMGNQVTASALDDRAGVATVLLAAERLRNMNAKITFMFSAQEEVGLRGAKIGAYNNDIDEAIVVDVSFAYTPSCKHSDCGDIGKGPMIGISPFLDRRMSNRLVEIAEREGIPYQTEVMSGATGTNADVITATKCGIKAALLSVPEKYMHSTVEVVDTTDIENVADLIVAYVKERVGDFDA